MTKQTTIVWFRNDLRLTDNPALKAAIDNGQIIPVFIVDNTAPESAVPGGASKWWLHYSLLSLNESLNKQLVIKEGNPLSVIQALLEEFSATHVVWNRVYEPWQIKRDVNIKTELKLKGIGVASFNGSLLWEPMSVLKKDETPYKVFTPYYRNGCLTRQSPRFPIAKPDQILIHPSAQFNLDALNSLALLPDINWYSDIEAMWEPGESGAANRLQRFIAEAATQYHNDRNIPSVKGTSLLSPHLHFGEVSPNQAWYAILGAFENAFDNKDLDVYLSELGWREFSYYLLFHFPELPTKNFNAKFDHFPWRKSADDLLAWQFGNTGVPIIDAGMRELYKTGYMHNRVRMVVGSFLVKNLLIDWRDGERWFWDTLLDADMASNSSGWQWVAGSGADASPYFRIFNPILQGERFDKDGEYVKQYCPELRKLPNKFIHKPWEAPDEILRACDVELGKTYPKPIVDLKVSRTRALDAFAQVKAMAQQTQEQS
ncbi:MAG: deoxyribodipyrimidine photo-lyase [Glaciecola sp.]|jgi:deoxyribodipyrimidine photo-lyase